MFLSYFCRTRATKLYPWKVMLSGFVQERLRVVLKSNKLRNSFQPTNTWQVWKANLVLWTAGEHSESQTAHPYLFSDKDMALRTDKSWDIQGAFIEVDFPTAFCRKAASKHSLYPLQSHGSCWMFLCRNWRMWDLSRIRALVCTSSSQMPVGIRQSLTGWWLNNFYSTYCLGNTFQKITSLDNLTTFFYHKMQNQV